MKINLYNELMKILIIFVWFGSDSNTTVTKLNNKCLLKYPDIKDNFVLRTTDTYIKN